MQHVNMIVRAVPKKNVQGMIRALRSAKLTVTKDSNGFYLCKLDGKTLFAAMPGRLNYLVRMQPDLFA
jgi:hypothetical protein